MSVLYDDRSSLRNGVELLRRPTAPPCARSGQARRLELGRSHGHGDLFAPRRGHLRHGAGDRITWTDLRERVHPEDREHARAAVDTAIASRCDYDIEYRIRTSAGNKWVAARGHATYGEDGTLVGMLGIVQDITETMLAKKFQREHSDALQIINNFGRLLSAELDLKKLAQALTDAATDLIGAQFGAFFYNVLDEGGGSYMHTRCRGSIAVISSDFRCRAGRRYSARPSAANGLFASPMSPSIHDTARMSRITAFHEDTCLCAVISRSL